MNGVEIAPGAVVQDDTLTIDTSKFSPPPKLNRRERRAQEAKSRASLNSTYSVYSTKTGAERISVLHPTKGYRDMSMARAMAVM